MRIYTAFLRGVNVGGKNVIKMADLKKVLVSMGLSRVQTYIQSGNILFESDESEQQLRIKIEQTIATAFGFSVAVVLRTLPELEQTAANLPFTKEEIVAAKSASEAEVLYVALLDRFPSQEERDRLEVYRNKTDEYRIIGQDIFLLFHHSIRDSKLANNLPKLNVPMTIRNWKTILKLTELARNMAD